MSPISKLAQCRPIINDHAAPGSGRPGSPAWPGWPGRARGSSASRPRRCPWRWGCAPKEHIFKDRSSRWHTHPFHTSMLVWMELCTGYCRSIGTPPPPRPFNVFLMNVNQLNLFLTDIFLPFFYFSRNKRIFKFYSNQDKTCLPYDAAMIENISYGG